MTTRAYLDHAATSPLRPEARDAMIAAFDGAGNASAVHAEGRAARKLVEGARSDVAALCGVDPGAVIFTSCGSEGAAMLLAPGLSIAARGPVERLVVGAVEHSCVLAGGRFAPADVSVCPVDGYGLVDLDALARDLAADRRRALVAVMRVVNETGVIQPVDEVARIVRAAGGILVVDAVQALGKLDGPDLAPGADAWFVSAHKIGAPQGVGAAVVAPGLVLARPLIGGGGQERRRRAGTENVAGIAGFGAAARALVRCGEGERAAIRRLGEAMETRLAASYPGLEVQGGTAPRTGAISSLRIPGLSGETAVIALDLAGVSIATGSACASGKVAPSHVLRAMGLSPAQAAGVVRVSLGWSTTEDDIERFHAALARHHATVTGRRAA